MGGWRLVCIVFCVRYGAIFMDTLVFCDTEAVKFTPQDGDAGGLGRGRARSLEFVGGVPDVGSQ